MWLTAWSRTQSTPSAQSATLCRDLPLGILGTLALCELSNRHRRVLLFSAVIIFGFWFGSVRGCIYRTDPNQDYMGRWKEKTMKFTCIFYIFDRENAESMAVSVNIFQELSPCTPAHFENAKVSRMPRGNLEIIRIPHFLITWWSWPPDCAKMQRMQGVSMKKHNNGNEKKGRIFFVGQDTFRVFRKALFTPDGLLVSL